MGAHSARAEPSDDGFDDEFGTALSEEPATGTGDPARPGPGESGQDEAEGASPMGVHEDARAEEPATRAPAPFVHNSLGGLTGGLHSVDAGSGPAGSVRFALTFDMFRRDGFLAAGDDHQRGAARASLSVTPIEHLELSLQGSVTSNLNRSHDPAVLQSVGDAQLFAKGYTRLTPWAVVGGDLGLIAANTIDGLGIQGNATSVSLRGSASFDLRNLPAHAMPVLARGNLRYVFDQSAQLVRTPERERYNQLNNPAPRAEEYRHLVSSVERFAYSISRVDRIELGFGFEFPLRPTPWLRLNPLLEWFVGLPVNRQGESCLLTTAATDPDGCLGDEGFSARPSTLTFGVRAEPRLPGLGVLLAVDVATSGARTFVRELAPNAPYNLYMGVAYAFDARPRKVRKAVQEPASTPQAQPPRAALARIRGQVIDKTSGAPVAGALVRLEGSEASPLVADEGGTFITLPIEKRASQLQIGAQGFRAAGCFVPVEAFDSPQTHLCGLEPVSTNGRIEGRVASEDGKPVLAARIAFSDPESTTVTADSSGAFAAELPAGTYEAQVTAPGYVARSASVTIETGEVLELDISLKPPPPKPARKERVERAGTRLNLQRPIRFQGDTAELTQKSQGSVAHLAAFLLRHGEIKQVEIQVHTDDRADSKQISVRQAEAVRTALIAEGVAGSRLKAVGFGASHPLAPNITEANRARNRRVVLRVRSAP